MPGYFDAVGDMKFRFSEGNAVIFRVEAFTDEVSSTKAFRDTGWKSAKHENQPEPVFGIVDQVAKKRTMSFKKFPDKLTALLQEAKDKKTVVPEVRYVLQINNMWRDEHSDRYQERLAQEAKLKNPPAPGYMVYPYARKGLVLSDVRVVDVVTKVGLEPRDFIAISAKTAVASDGFKWFFSPGVWLKGLSRPVWAFEMGPWPAPPSL